MAEWPYIKGGIHTCGCALGVRFPTSGCHPPQASRQMPQHLPASRWNKASAHCDIGLLAGWTQEKISSATHQLPLPPDLYASGTVERARLALNTQTERWMDAPLNLCVPCVCTGSALVSAACMALPARSGNSQQSGSRTAAAAAAAARDDEADSVDQGTQHQVQRLDVRTDQHGEQRAAEPQQRQQEGSGDVSEGSRTFGTPSGAVALVWTVRARGRDPTHAGRAEAGEARAGGSSGARTSFRKCETVLGLTRARCHLCWVVCGKGPLRATVRLVFLA